MAFPSLSPSELMESIRALDFRGGFTTEDVTKPSPVKFQVLLEWFLLCFLQISREDIRFAVQQELDEMEYPELYEYAITLGVFYQTVNQLMVFASIHDFSTKDITSPTPERVRRILSGLVNFILFQNEQASGLLHPLEDRVDHLAQQQDVLDRENAETERRIQERQFELAQHEEAAQKLHESNNEAKAELLKLKREEERIQRKKKDVGDIGKPLRNEISTIVKNQLLLDADIGRIKTRIVLDPEKVQTSIEDLRKGLEAERHSVADLEEKTREFEGKLRVMSRYEVDLKNCIRIMDEWEVELERSREAQERVRGCMEELDTRQHEVKELDTSLTHAIRRYAVLQEQEMRLATSGQARRLAMQEKVDNAKKQQRQLLEERGELNEEWHKMQNEAREWENKIRALAESSERELERGAAAYKALRVEVLVYSTAVNQALDQLNTLNST